MLCDPHGDHTITDCTTDSINFFQDTIIPIWSVCCFPNNKAWITSDLKALLNEKRRIFRSGNKDKLRKIQCELNEGLRRCKNTYREKLKTPAE